MKFVAKTLYGLEDVLAGELISLGAGNVSRHNRAVAFEGSKSLLYSANYNSRLALSVLVPLAEFRISGQKDLYSQAVAIDWERFIDTGSTYAVTAVVNSRHFNHSGYAALLVKDAIADFFRRLTQRRPSVDQHNPDLLVNVHISNDTATISADSTQVPLFKRGYKLKQTEAPLNEVLASGMISLSGWQADMPFTDPMCGSGTLPIEAGLIACRIAPGKFRKHFGFMRWKDYNPDLFRSVKFDAEKRERRSPVPIFASDISTEAVTIAKGNIAAAGLGGIVELRESDFFKEQPPVGGGLFMVNPPYGQRIGVDDTGKFYGDMGSILKHSYSGFEAWILSGNAESLKNLALRPYRKFDLINGDIKCKFQGYRLYKGSLKGDTANNQ